MARILVVDDEPDILMLLRLTLAAEGHDVVLAADGEKALERIAGEEPDIVVLDVMMPVLDGWGVLEALRNVDSAPPIVVVSAKTASADVAHALGLGAADYIAKPFDPSGLAATLTAVLGRTTEERAVYRAEILERIGPR